MRLNTSALYDLVKKSGEPPDPQFVAELYASLEDEARRAVFYGIIEHIEAGHVNRVVEWPKFGPQGELFK